MTRERARDRRDERVRHGHRQAERAPRRAPRDAGHARGVLPGSGPRRPRRPARGCAFCCTRFPIASRTSSSSRARTRSARSSSRCTTRLRAAPTATGSRELDAPTDIAVALHGQGRASARSNRRCASSRSRGAVVNELASATRVFVRLLATPRAHQARARRADSRRSSGCCARSGASAARAATTARTIDLDGLPPGFGGACGAIAAARRAPGAPVRRVGAQRRRRRARATASARSPRFRIDWEQLDRRRAATCASSTRCSSTRTRTAAGAASCCATSAIPPRATRARAATTASARTTRRRRRAGATRRASAGAWRERAARRRRARGARPAVADSRSMLDAADAQPLLVAALRDAAHVRIAREEQGAGVRRLPRPHAGRDGGATAGVARRARRCARRRTDEARDVRRAFLAVFANPTKPKQPDDTMDDSLYFTEQHLAMREMVREFARDEVAPVAAQATTPTRPSRGRTSSKMGELGLLGVPWPEELGGAGLDLHRAT